MVKNELMIIADYSRIEPLTLTELCQICHIDNNVVDELIVNEIIHPHESNSDEWIIDLAELTRARRALRLQRELEINFTTVALVMDLLDKMDELRSHVALLKKHYF